MFDVAVIDDPAAAEVSLDPVRAGLLAALAEPGSASTLAARAGLPRQKVNYHLRALERHGLVELVEERRKGNCTERVLQATAASYVISPTALAAVAPDPDRAPDQLSARWLLALAPRLVQEVGVADRRRPGGAQAAGHVRGRQRDPVRVGGCSGRLRRRVGRGRCRSGRPVPRRDGGGRSPHRFVVALHPSLKPNDPDPTTKEQ